MKGIDSRPVPANVTGDWVDDFGERHITIDLGEGVTHHLHIAPRAHIGGREEYITIPIEPGTGQVPGCAIIMQYEGEPRIHWFGLHHEDEITDVWMADLARRNPDLLTAFSEMFKVIHPDLDDDEE